MQKKEEESGFLPSACALIEDLECTYDVDSFFANCVDPSFGGFGSSRRLYRAGDGQVHQYRDRNAEVFHLHFFLPANGIEVALMRYQTSSQSKVWLPEGADGMKPVGVNLFKKDAVLPELSSKPSLAPFDLPFKKQETIQEVLTSLHDNHPEHVSKAQQDEYVRFFQAIPTKAEFVPLHKRPRWELRPNCNLPSLSGGRSEPADRSVLDPADTPIVPPITDNCFQPSRKRALVQEHLRGMNQPCSS